MICRIGEDDDAEALIVRPRSEIDDATPSAASLMAANLIRLWHLTGRHDYLADADAVLTAASGTIAANLFATTGLLSALDLRIQATEVVVLGADDLPANDLVAAARRDPTTILLRLTDTAQLPPGHPAAGKAAIGGKATAYVCRGETCSLPVTEPDQLAALMTAGRG